MRNIEDWLASANDELMEAREGSNTLKDRLDLMWDRIQRQFDTFNPILESGIIEEINALYSDLDSAIDNAEAATSAASAAAETASTAAQGKVNKTGDTMTGPLIIKGSAPYLAFKNENDNLICSFRYSNNKATVRVRNINDFSKYEDYYFPNATTTNNPGYDILTTKNVITIPQGGTGATTPADALTNLGAVAKSGDTMTGDLSIKSSRINFTDDNDQIKAFITCRADQNKWGQFVIQEKVQNSSYYENYNLPIPDSTSSQNYDILTTKNLVTLRQGGTGVSASSNADLLEQLGINAAIANAIIGEGVQLDIRDDILQIGSGGTGATTAAAARIALQITPANIGAVSKAGDTMTGSLTISTGSTSPVLYLDNTANSGHAAAILFHNTNQQISFRQYPPTSDKTNYEYYTFPAVASSLSSKPHYQIWTTKEYPDPLPVTKGGTGATTPSTALAALGGLSASDLGLTNGAVSIDHGGTGATSLSAAKQALGISLSALGAVNKAGDTMTGNLIVSTNTYPAICVGLASTGNTVGAMMYNTAADAPNSQMLFRVYNDNTRIRNDWYLPPTRDEQESNGSGRLVVCQNLPNGTDANDIITSGMYYCSSTTVNLPSNIVNGYLIVIANAFDPTAVKQIFSRHGTRNTNDHETYLRTRISGTWSDWTEIITGKGGTMKTQLIFDGGQNYNGIAIKGASGAPTVSIRNTGSRLTIDQYTDGSTGGERFLMPTPSARQSDIWYEILTTKAIQQDITIKGSTRLYFQDADANNIFRIQYANNRFYVQTYDPATEGKYTNFRLPTSDNNNKTYEIITNKSISEITVSVPSSDIPANGQLYVYTPTRSNLVCISAYFVSSSNSKVISVSQPCVFPNGQITARILNPTSSAQNVSGTMHFIFIESVMIQSS